MNTDEMDAEELADWCLSHPRRHCSADKEIVDALRQIDAEDAARKSIAESPVWKDQQFLSQLSHDFMAKDFEKSRATTKHYIDAGQARVQQMADGKIDLTKSIMGNPKRGADGRLLRDARGQVIWDTSAEQQFNPTDVNLRNAQENSGQDCGHCIFYRFQDSACQIVAGPIAAVLICDKFTAKPTLEQRVAQVQQMADGKIDITKSIMGNPKRNADGTYTWEIK